MARRELSAQDALDPRSKPSMDELFRLIHSVNPTDRGLAPAETARRYAVKSRLQSLLVRRFGHTLTVEEDGEGVILLRQRTGDRDFCHAVLATLDDDARAWVREQQAPELAPVAASAPQRGAPAGEKRASGPIQQAAAAIEEWDYDAARELLERAHADGHAGALAALADLLVDLLVDDAGALALDVTGASPAVRARIAVAAARSGDSDRAQRLLVDVPDGPAAEARVHLARGELQAGRIESAGRLLAAAKAGNPGLPELSALADAFGAARRALVAPLVAELAAIRAAGGDGEPVARRILEADPDDRTARDVVREATASRRGRRADALIAEADAARDAGDYPRAKTLYLEAREHGAQVDAALEALAQLAGAARVERVRRALRGDRLEGLVAWLGLDATQRGGVGVELPELAWLAGIEEPGARAAIFAAAALAAHDVAGRLDAGSPEDALAALTPRRDAIAELRGGKALIARVERALVKRRQDAADAALEHALQQTDPTQARAALEAVPRDDLAPGREAALDAALARATTAAELAALERHAESADRFVARDAANTLADRTGDPAWGRRAAALQAEIQAAFGVAVWPAPGGHLGDFLLERLDRARGCLTADGDVILVASRARHLIVRRVDPDGGVRLAITLRLPEGLDRVDVRVEGDVAWIGGNRPVLLGLRLDGAVLGLWDLRPFVDAGRAFAGVRVSPGGQTAWVAGLRTKYPTWTLVDLGRRTSLGPRGTLTHLDPLPGAPGRMVGIRPGRGIAMLDADGRALPGWNDRTYPLAMQVAIHPTDPGRLLATWDPVNPAEAVPPATGWVELGRPRPEAHFFDASLSQWGSDVLASRAEGAVFVAARGPAHHLACVATGEPAAAEAWSIATKKPRLLAGDADATRVVALYPTDRGVGTAVLTSSRPDFPGEIEIQPPRVPSGAHGDCQGQRTDPRWMPLLSYAGAQIRRWSAADAPRELIEAAAKLDDSAPLGALLVAAQNEGIDGHGIAIRDAAHRFPRNPFLVMLAANQEAIDDRWEAAERRARSIPEVERPSLGEGHVHHFLGLTRWHQGDLRGAIAEWTKAEDHPGGCPTAALIELAERYLGQNPTLDTLTGRIADAISAADAALARGEPLRAIACLQPAELWAARELQVAARRAAAWLELGPEPGLARLVALTAWRELWHWHGADGRTVADIPVPGAWTRERFAALDAAVADALGEPVEWETGPPLSVLLRWYESR